MLMWYVLFLPKYYFLASVLLVEHICYLALDLKLSISAIYVGK